MAKSLYFWSTTDTKSYLTAVHGTSVVQGWMQGMRRLLIFAGLFHIKSNQMNQSFIVSLLQNLSQCHVYKTLMIIFYRPCVEAVLFLESVLFLEPQQVSSKILGLQ